MVTSKDGNDLTELLGLRNKQKRQQMLRFKGYL